MTLYRVRSIVCGELRLWTSYSVQGIWGRGHSTAGQQDGQQEARRGTESDRFQSLFGAKMKKTRRTKITIQTERLVVMSRGPYSRCAERLNGARVRMGAWGPVRWALERSAREDGGRSCNSAIRNA